MVLDTLAITKDLLEIYITGGGVEGAIQALRETTKPGANQDGCTSAH